MTTRSRIIGIAAVAALILLALYAIGRPRPIAVDLGAVTKGTLTVTVDEEGTTRVRRHEDVSAPVAGIFVPAAPRAGDRVAAGATLGTIRPAPLDSEAVRQARARITAGEAAVSAAESQKRAAQATMDEAQVVFGRRERLAATGGVSQEELERARLELSGARDGRDAASAHLEAARAELAAARAVLDVRRGSTGERAIVVRAPIGGVVLRLIEEHERAVPPGALLAQVGEPADLEIVIPLLTADAARVKPGAAVTFTAGAGEAPLHATVTVIEPAAFTKLSPLGVQEQRVNVIAKVAGPANGLGDAFRVDARITVQEVRDAVIVPSAALVRHGEAWTAWAVQGGRAMPREVTIGPRARDGVAVRTGLSPGDSVVLYPPEALTSGARVRRGGA